MLSDRAQIIKGTARFSARRLESEDRSRLAFLLTKGLAWRTRHFIDGEQVINEFDEEWIASLFEVDAPRLQGRSDDTTNLNALEEFAGKNLSHGERLYLHLLLGNLLRIRDRRKTETETARFDEELLARVVHPSQALI